MTIRVRLRAIETLMQITAPRIRTAIVIVIPARTEGLPLEEPGALTDKGP